MNNFKFPKDSGTPKSLKEAIKNGLEHSKNCPGFDPEEVMFAHIKEFTAQRFSCYSDSSDVMKLWKNIFHNDAKS